jgi:glycosyltransferase involved in cell wall biosynthesis
VRILYHHRTLADGAEGIHIAAMIDAFKQLGHDVRLMAPASNGPVKPSALAGIRRALPRWAFECASAAVNLPEYIEARRLIQSFDPDLIYARLARYDVATLAAARHAGVPSVVEANSLFTQGAYHGFEQLAWLRLARRFERRALELATVVVAVSTPLAEQIQRFAGRPAHVLPNGADPRLFDSARADGRAVRGRFRIGRSLVVGWSGIVREWHGVERLLDAVIETNGAHLLIVGDGPARPALEARAARLGAADRMTITGRVPHQDMPQYLAAMDIAVVADERTGVASPMKLLEYMSMSRAVVAPRLPNIIDIIEHGVDGLLFTPDNGRELVDAIQRLASDDELRRTVGSSARDKIERERNWLAIAAHVLSLVHPRNSLKSAI